jgi:hypothetical protein
MSIRDKLEEAWDSIARERGLPWATANAPRFTRLLDAEAWLDAAVMLSSDWELCLQRWPQSGWTASIWTDEHTEYMPDEVLPTPAEALLAAIEKART